jgi:plasmid stability protein
MASITIRNLDDGLKRRLRVRAAENGRSMEEEARDILRRTVGEAPPPKDLGRTIHARFTALGGVELELPERGPMRPPPKFG